MMNAAAAADLRAAIARANVPLYRIAALAGCHPTRLGAMLNERAPWSPDVAARVLDVLAGAAGDKSSA
jgi:hypothetical protein